MSKHSTSSATRWSMVTAAGTDSPAGRAALAWLCERYWQPLRAHARRRGFRDDEDETQSFLASLIERGGLAQVDRERGRFRTWLLACFDHHLANRLRHQQAQKRGAGHVHVKRELDHLQAVDEDPIRSFNRDWAVTVLAHSHARLEREQDAAARDRFALLKKFLVVNGDGFTYAAAGKQIGMGESAVKVAVHRLRQRLRELVRAEISETLAETDPKSIEAEMSVFLDALKENL